MNFTSASLSEGCIRELYTQNRCEVKHPSVQILDFQQSEANEKEITIRISDGNHFIDCTLFGNYLISNNAVIETKNATTVTTFKRCQIVKLIDYFSKIDENRITKLKIMIRKMGDCTNWNEIIGYPQEIHQFMVNARTPQRDITEPTAKKSKLEREGNGGRADSIPVIKLESAMDVEMPTTTNTPPTSMQKNIKRELQHPQLDYQATQAKQANGHNPNKVQSLQGMNESLTLNQILSGKQGFLIARLVRFKAAKKETKDGIMTVCYLGLVDKHNEFIRVHLAGRLAMNNEKTLKKNKSYYIRGFDLVNLKNSGTQIRLKEKQYKIVQVYNEQLTKQLPSQYYCWDHQSHDNDNNESEFVDVIGMIDDIEEKATYTNDTKSVIRLVLKNRFKSIRISFWTDQMKNFENFNLKKKEWIIVEDIRKKQGKYYDFSLESSLIHLSEFPFLQERFKDIFPQGAPEIIPQNTRQLLALFNDDPNNSKLQTIKVYLSSFKDNKLIYHICDDCKKKVEKSATECQQCGSQHLIFKYNCPLEFSDSTGSIVAILFDAAAQKLIGKTANQINEMSDDEIDRLFQTLLFRYFLITVQNRNQRIILRNIEQIDQNQQVSCIRETLQKINQNFFRQLW